MWKWAQLRKFGISGAFVLTKGVSYKKIKKYFAELNPLVAGWALLF
ncbi:MAG: hypothetical protein U0944_01105 [Candidatus Moranbacteria bacterium]|nr:hypothetical protein [Candidatus Moranbacteria bacterium]